MLECLIVGDSIGLGVSQYRPDCHVQAVVGISTQKWLNTTTMQTAKKVLISLGSNDINLYPTNLYNRNYQINKQIEILKQVRQRYTGYKVYWVLPANNKVLSYQIKQIAILYNDTTIEIEKLQKDGTHPTPMEYKRIAYTFK